MALRWTAIVYSKRRGAQKQIRREFLFCMAYFTLLSLLTGNAGLSTGYYKTSIHIYQTTRCHMPQDIFAVSTLTNHIFTYQGINSAMYLVVVWYVHIMKQTNCDFVRNGFIVCPCNMIDIFIITNTMHTIAVDKITLFKTT